MFTGECAERDYGAGLSLLVALHLGYIGIDEQVTLQ
jgi:hypothetical protein